MAHQTFLPGNDSFAATAAPDGRYGAFFDDDGESAFFYALDLDSDELILDAVHVYDVAAIAGRKRHTSLDIVWSPDGHKCALLLDGRPRAAFDFEARRGFTHSIMHPGGPEHVRGLWRNPDHRWSDSAIDWLELRKSA